MSGKVSSRRSFLKMSAIAVASTALASCAPAAPTTAPVEPKPADTAVPEATKAAAPTATQLPKATEAPKKAEVALKWWDFPRSWAKGGTAENPMPGITIW